MLVRCRVCGHPYWQFTRRGSVGERICFGDVGQGSVRFGRPVLVCSTCAEELNSQAVELMAGDEDYRPYAVSGFSGCTGVLVEVVWQAKPGWSAR